MATVVPIDKPQTGEIALPEGVSADPIKTSIGSYISGYRFDGDSVCDEFGSAMRDLLHSRTTTSVRTKL